MGKLRSDAEIGLKIRMFRHQAGLTQEKLAEELEITFQQVQKYERGVTKVNLVRLQQLAEILRVPISSFFDNSSSHAFQLSEEEKQLLHTFRRIKSSVHKNSVLDIMAVLAKVKS